METFCCWPFLRGIHRWPVDSPHKGQWRWALMFSLICAWTNGWANNPDAGDLRRHRDNYDVIVIDWLVWTDFNPMDDVGHIQMLWTIRKQQKESRLRLWKIRVHGYFVKKMMLQTRRLDKYKINHQHITIYCDICKYTSIKWIKTMKKLFPLYRTWRPAVFLNWISKRRLIYGLQVVNGSNNGLAPIRRQAIIWSNDGLVYWRI